MRIPRNVCAPPTKFHIGRLAIPGMVLISTLLLTSCGFISHYGRYSGINLIASRGNPAADNLIWSRTNPNKVLVNASEVGFGYKLSSQVFIYDIATREKTMVAKTDSDLIIGETWSPDNAKVVLDISPNIKGYENYTGLWIWNAQNGSLDFLRERGSAIWSPTGKTIAIFDYTVSDGPMVLHLIDVDTRKEESMTIGEINTTGYGLQADWSPDGNHLVLSMGNLSLSIKDNLFTYDISSHQLVQITTEGDNLKPVWSPYGNMIAYIKYNSASGKDALHLISIDGSCDIEFPFIDWISSTTWSPDGKRLAFVGDDGIYTIDIETFMKKYMKPSSCLKP